MSSDVTPKYGRRLLATQIDELAHNEPERVWMSVASMNPCDGFREITWANLANAINHAAWWIESTVGHGQNIPTIAYVGPNDVRYHILMMAVVKTGFKLLLTSPRNSIAGHVSLLEATKCNILFYAAPHDVSDILRRKLIQSWRVPDLSTWLEAGRAPRYPYTAKFEDVQSDPYLVIHTSGSTGLPKPVFLPQSRACQCDISHLVPPLEGRKTTWCGIIEANCGRFFSGLPFFHAGGITNSLSVPAYLSVTTVVGPPDRPLNAPLLDDIIDHGRIDVAILPPSILEDMSQSESSLNRLARLKAVICGGGTMSEAAGRAASQRVRVHNWIGSTENGSVHSHIADADAWQYFCFNPLVNGIDWRPTPEKDVFEMVFVRSAKLGVFQDIFKTFPDIDEYATNDLFRKHPTKPHHWIHAGRADDIIVLSNGEKVLPREIESLIGSYPTVKAVIVVGKDRFNIAAIIEPRTITNDQARRKQILDEIWPAIAEANKISPSHSQIAKPYVMLSSPDKPFLRAGKGTVQRPQTVELYREEIKNLYLTASTISDAVEPPLESLDRGSLSKILHDTIERYLGFPIATDQDFIVNGIDSFRVMQITNTLRERLGKIISEPRGRISTRLVYTNSTIELLLESLYMLGTQATSINYPENELAFAQLMLSRYTTNWPEGVTKTRSSHPEALSVLLTGSTGSLGSYILDLLVTSPKIATIYCINRSDDALQRQTTQNESRHLSTSWENVHFLRGDLSKIHFGLGEAIYADLKQNIDLIIHNQWQVNFNLALTSFEPHIQGIYQIACFSSQAATHVPILFTSSTGTAFQTSSEVPCVPESSQNNIQACTTGYAKSKIIAHIILEAANRTIGVPVTILRVGQIAGPVLHGEHGAWPQHEWFPSLLASSLFLDTLPASLGTMEALNFVPVDIVAKAVIELAIHSLGLHDGADQDGDKVTYFHIANPQDTSWCELLPYVQACFGKTLAIVPFEEWVSRLRESMDAREVDVGANPGLNLVEWYEGLKGGENDKEAPRAKLDISIAKQFSPTLREMKPVSSEWVELWLRQWKLI